MDELHVEVAAAVPSDVTYNDVIRHLLENHPCELAEGTFDWNGFWREVRSRRAGAPADYREHVRPAADEDRDWVLSRLPSPSSVLGYDRLYFFAPGALDTTLLGRIRQHHRESRPQSRRSSRTRLTRAGPSDEPHLAELSPLQAGFLAFLDGLVTASEGGLETYTAFLDLIGTRVAAETARLLDQEAQ